MRSRCRSNHVFTEGQRRNWRSPKPSASIFGTAPLASVALIRDNKYVFGSEPGAEQHQLRYRENAVAPGEHYHYVRVKQKDRMWRGLHRCDHLRQGKENDQIAKLFMRDRLVSI